MFNFEMLEKFIANKGFYSPEQKMAAVRLFGQAFTTEQPRCILDLVDARIRFFLPN